MHKYFFLLFGVILCAGQFTKAFRLPSCGNSNLTDPVGSINSPHYPEPFDSQVQCEWLIRSPRQTLLKLHMMDLDLDEDCSQQWLSIPNEGGRGHNILCGREMPTEPIEVIEQFTYIKYYSSAKKKSNRGFALKYSMENVGCGPKDLQCRSGECVSNTARCDGLRDCRDGSDELDCPAGAWCQIGFLSCPTSTAVCYSITDQICNGEFVCPRGEDEVGCTAECPNQIACSSGDGCYDPAQRCNNVRNCRDNSDETQCGTERCAPLEFICRNGGCVSATAICDNNNDCGDFSDEEHCVKPSILTAIPIGMLSCGLISCLGLFLLYRFYLTRLRNTTVFLRPVAPIGDFDSGFVYREPPPPYLSAISDSYTLPRLDNCRQSRRYRRRPRRCGRLNRPTLSFVAAHKESPPPAYDREETDVPFRSHEPSVSSFMSVDDLLLLDTTEH